MMKLINIMKSSKGDDYVIHIYITLKYRDARALDNGTIDMRCESIFFLANVISPFGSLTQ